jgi:hypothetical protein
MKIRENFDWWLVQTTDRATEPLQRNTVQKTSIKALDGYSLPTSRTCLTQLSSVSQDPGHSPHIFNNQTLSLPLAQHQYFINKVVVPLKPWIRMTQTITCICICMICACKQACSMNDTDIGLFFSIARCSSTDSFLRNQSRFEFTVHNGNGEAWTFQSHESQNLNMNYIITFILPE